jgi:hypothetical protein
LNARRGGGETLRTEPKSSETNRGSPPETTIRSGSRGLHENLAHALALAAEAGEWRVVETLARQLDSLRATGEGAHVRVLPGGRTRT